MTTDNLNNPAWLAANADYNHAYEVACSRAIKRLMAENECMKRRIESDRIVMSEVAEKLIVHSWVAHDGAAITSSAQLEIEQPGLI